MVLELVGAPAHRATLGPAEWYRVEGPRLYAGQARLVLAEYHDGFWRTSATQFSAIHCRVACSCHFEQGTGRHDDVEGPYGGISLLGAVFWADDHALARLDPATALWHLLRTASDYRAICWRPAHGFAAPGAFQP